MQNDTPLTATKAAQLSEAMAAVGATRKLEAAWLGCCFSASWLAKCRTVRQAGTKPSRPPRAAWLIVLWTSPAPVTAVLL
jgi:hypothetical protein